MQRSSGIRSCVRARNLTSDSASTFALAVALPLAWQRDARAEDFFARVSTHDLDDGALEWRARAALWAGNWPLVTQTIATMSESEPAKRALALLDGAGPGAGRRYGAGAPAVRGPRAG